MAIGLENINALWASLVVEELVRNGVGYACISSGSRSTPLTIAAARNAELQKKICYDERAAAYHALGHARATGLPAMLICTSGTAAANYYPAIVEASMDHVPLIVLTADRPPELYDTGANQTIFQAGMYGNYVRKAAELPCPTETIDPRMVLTTAGQLFYRAIRYPAGPVHLNCMFREPLALEAVKMNDDYMQQLADWMVEGSPYTTHSMPQTSVSETDLKSLSTIINAAKTGLLIAGRLGQPQDSKAVRDLAAHLEWPLFADVLSGCRVKCGQSIPYYDQLLSLEEMTDTLKPDVVLQIGGTPVSKRLLQFIDSYGPQQYILVDQHPGRTDPAHRVSHRVEADIAPLCTELMARAKGKSKLLTPLAAMNTKAGNALKEILSEGDKITEPGVAVLTAQHVPDGWGLWLASSMPVRDMDMFCPAFPAKVRVAANRGASGIDGTIAAATGFAEGIDQPVMLMIGDLAFIHDMNSLDLVKKSAQPLIIVLINNRGGGIFHFLPIARHESVFGPWFTTPHNYRFDAVARQFNLPYVKCETRSDYTRELVKAMQNKQSMILEVLTKGDKNVKFHNDIRERIEETIRYH